MVYTLQVLRLPHADKIEYELRGVQAILNSAGCVYPGGMTLIVITIIESITTNDLEGHRSSAFRLGFKDM